MAREPMRRDQFTFYRSYYDALRELPKRDQAATLMAILAYALDGTVPTELSSLSAAIFGIIRPVLDSGRKKAEARAKNREAEKPPDGEK